MTASSRKSAIPAERTHAGLQALGWQVNIHSYSWSPPTDVYETDASFVVRLEVAGMRESDFSINADKNYLVISGLRTDMQERRAYHRMEIRFGEFSTAVELPSNVDIDKAEAEYEDGFLTVVVPKIKPTEIKLRS